MFHSVCVNINLDTIVYESGNFGIGVDQLSILFKFVNRNSQLFVWKNIIKISIVNN